MRIVWALPVLGAALAVSLAQVKPTDDPAFQKNVQPVITRNCLGCHNSKLLTANLDLAAAAKPEVWSKVRDKLAAGQMPPPGMPAPSKTEIDAVLAWIDNYVGAPKASAQATPGRVMARRLNRVEYNNTIRDLLAVPSHPADEFPVDDSGYGFDNIGDVLTVSPMLMEKYLDAAAKVSRLAVFGASAPDKPTRLARLLSRRSQDAYDVVESGNYGTYLPYSLRGALYGNWTFPVTGEYEFRLRIANFRKGVTPARTAPAGPRAAGARAAAAPGAAAAGGPRRRGPRVRREPTEDELRARDEANRLAAPPRKLLLAVDGKPIITEVVEGDGDFGYSRGEYVVRVPVTAGEHYLRASYPELADLDNPLDNINPDMRRGLFIDYLDIVGPFDPSAQPPASYSKLFVCGHAPGAHTAACARTILEHFLPRAYRRPVTNAEIEAKLRLVDLARKEGDSFEEGIRLALEAVLASPDFLFHVERDPAPAAGAQPLNDYELASRLSYFLWSSMPDEELFRLAAAKRLSAPGVVEQQVRRMMADPKSINLVDNFAAQWLQLRNLGRTKPDPGRFPTVDDELLDDMRQETSLFVQELIRDDHSVLDFLDAPFTYVNGPLAHHYGIPGVEGEQFRRVTLDGTQRGGIITQGAILTVSSYPTRTSPPVRGKWVLENLLGTPPPPPPANVPVLDESNLGKTVSLRERLEQHRKDPSCSPCHNRMDPIGFGLESYNAVGKWRTMDGDVQIDTSGTLPDGKSFAGAQQLKQLLRAQSEAFTHNLTEKLFTFALARGLEPADRSTVDAIVQKVAANDYRFSTLVLEIVNSKPFRMRSGAGE